MRAGQVVVLCTLFATFFAGFPVLAEKDMTGQWVIEIQGHSITTKTDMVTISKENDNYEITPDDKEWEVAPVEDFKVKDGVITFRMGGVVSCKLNPEENVWSGKCVPEHEENSAESFSVILRSPEKPANASTGDKESSESKESK